MQNTVFKIFIALCCLFPQIAKSNSVSVSSMRKEQMESPIGLDTSIPRFSWRLESKAKNVMQTAYEILVASSPELLTEEKADLWRSGKILSD